MKTKIVTFLALITFLITVSGCGSSNTNNNSDTSSPTSSSPSASGSEVASPSYEGVTVRIGYQGKGGLFGKIQEMKWLDEAFSKYGAKVEFSEFQSGPPMVEAMASNHLDFAGMGNLPPIAAQAAGIDFTIISQTLSGKNNVALLVPNNSTIQTVADLKGKKVAVTKGSNAFNFLYQLLEKEGLKDSDLQIIQLQPDETQAAFDAGKVDAWSVWDPSITLNTMTGKARIIADGESAGLLSPSFQLVRSEFADKYPELIVAYLKVIEKAIHWQSENNEEALKRYADENKIPVELMKGFLDRSTYINVPVSPETISQQQATADFQYKLGTIRNEVEVSKVFDNRFIEEALKQYAEESKS
ncbi:aliphatic sulfonate ABC transporter substrate-binding protein [Paenibacillus borealis]|uniref:Putative aliphatic sulfonates-binding protein n=1 Tax=Paenibacillus borealis TaxID=160799 RepID=A0A089L690_PAEBO|nr:aliphatic sulfonate ABC transporter substrate-binding protein [Paenibacillus borealis]AIQ56971.1 sulfonate ABC transporter substrate-binding protein [Paenibacillus borealis]